MPPQTEASPESLFKAALDELAIVGGFSNHVSMVVTGSATDERHQMASTVHAKICANARSIGAISKSSMFDHSAIMSVARMIVDGMTMFFYLWEDIDDNVWDLRYFVLRLHDTVARIKLVRAWQDKSDYADLIAGKNELLEKIRSNAHYRLLGEDQQEKLVTGEQIFVGGMRRAAMQTGAWREETFIATYNYLSAHSHSAPISFFRFSSHSIDYRSPSHAQFASACFAIEIATACLRRVTLRYLDYHLEKFPQSKNEFADSFVQKLRDKDGTRYLFT